MSEGYLGNDRLKRVGVELSYTEEQIKEIIKFLFWLDNERIKSMIYCGRGNY